MSHKRKAPMTRSKARGMNPKEVNKEYESLFEPDKPRSISFQLPSKSLPGPERPIRVRNSSRRSEMICPVVCPKKGLTARAYGSVSTMRSLDLSYVAICCKHNNLPSSGNMNSSMKELCDPATCEWRYGVRLKSSPVLHKLKSEYLVEYYVKAIEATVHTLTDAIVVEQFCAHLLQQYTSFDVFNLMNCFALRLRDCHKSHNRFPVLPPVLDVKILDKVLANRAVQSATCKRESMILLLKADLLNCLSNRTQ